MVAPHPALKLTFRSIKSCHSRLTLEIRTERTTYAFMRAEGVRREACRAPRILESCSRNGEETKRLPRSPSSHSDFWMDVNGCQLVSSINHPQLLGFSVIQTSHHNFNRTTLTLKCISTIFAFLRFYWLGIALLQLFPMMYWLDVSISHVLFTRAFNMGCASDIDVPLPLLLWHGSRENWRVDPVGGRSTNYAAQATVENLIESLKMWKHHHTYTCLHSCNARTRLHQKCFFHPQPKIILLWMKLERILKNPKSKFLFARKFEVCT